MFRASLPNHQSVEFDQQAMNEEREALDNFISKLTEGDLLLVEPLFYRRVLSAKESVSIEERLQTDWGVSQAYWYPLAERKREDIEAFQDTYFETELGTEKLRTILRRHGIERLWEMREDGINSVSYTHLRAHETPE